MRMRTQDVVQACAVAVQTDWRPTRRGTLLERFMHTLERAQARTYSHMGRLAPLVSDLG